MAVYQLINTIETEYRNGNSAQALKYARKLGNKLATMSGAAVPYATCLFYEGRILVDEGNWQDANAPLSRCINLLRENGSIDNGYYLMAQLAMADAYFNLHENDQAETLYREIGQSAVYGDDPGLKTKLSHKYAVIAERRRDYEEAIKGYEQYLAEFLNLHSKQASTYQEFYRYKEKLKLALRAKRAGFEGDFMNDKGLIQATFESGDGTIMDVEYAEYLVSDLPDPDNRDIEALIDEGTFLRIELPSSEKLITLTDENRTELKKALLIHKVPGEHNMAHGEVTLSITDQSINAVGRIEYFKEGKIRLASKWKPDAVLVNNSKLNDLITSLVM